MWKKRRWLFWVICVIIGLCIIPKTAKAAEVTTTTYTSEQVGEGLQAELSADGTLVISGSGEMNNWYYGSSTPWYDNRTAVKKIVIESGVVSVGSYAFYDCSALTEIELPTGLTSIGNNAFQNCDALTKVKIPKTLTSVGSSGAFSDCDGLTRVIFESGMTTVPANVCRNMSNLESVEFETDAGGVCEVTEIGDCAFSNCQKLADLELPAGLTVIGGSAFSYCQGLTDLELPAGLTAIGESAFYECENLTGLELPAGLTSIGSYAFYYCKALTEIRLPDGIAELARNTFYNCTALKTVDLNNVIIIRENAFNGCSVLENVYLTRVETLENNAFQNCDALTKVKIPETLASVGSSGAFSGCENLTQVIFASGMTEVPANVCRNMSNLASVEFETDAAGVCEVTEIGDSAFSNCQKLVDLELPAGLTVIGGSAFSYCQGLTGLKLPAGLTTIGESVFYDCEMLTGLELPTGLTSIGSYAFYNCQKLADLELPAGLTAIGDWAFYGCSALTEIRLPDGVTELARNTFYNCTSLGTVDLNNVTTIRASAFYGCSALETLDLKKAETLENYAFQNCRALTEVRIPETLTSVGGYGAFSGCENLTHVIFASGMTVVPANVCQNMSKLESVEFETDANGVCEVTEIGNNAFYNCLMLTEIRLPVGLTTIGNYAFYHCPMLAEIKLPVGLTTIGNDAFYNCSGLQTLVLPEGLMTINTEAFYGCSGLRDVIIPESTERIGSRAFANCRSLYVITLGDQLTAGSIDKNAFYRSSQAELLVQTDNTYLREEYDWSGSRITPVYAVKSYAAGENGRVIVFEDGIMAIVGSGAMADYDGSDLVPWKEDLANLRYLFIGNGITRIGNYAFAGSSLQNLWLKDCFSLREVGDYAFADNEGLNYIMIGVSLETIGEHAFCLEEPVSFLLDTGTDVTITYDWEGDNRIVDDETVVYPMTDMTLAYVKDGTLILRGRGPGGEYSGSNQPWKKDAFTKVDIQDGITRIGKNSFYQMTGITDVTFPETCREIGDNAFYGCTELSQISLPEKLGSIGGSAFYECTSLTRFLFPETVSSIGANAFSGCTSLQQITLPGALTELGQAAFKGCQSVGTINIESVALNTIPASAFEGCSALRTIAIPSCVKQIAKRAFASCEKLNTVKFSEGITTLEGEAFGDCENLVSVQIPRSLTTANTSDNVGPFGTSLQKVTFAEKARTVPANLFYGCTALTDAALPDMLSEIENNAFYGCTALEEIVFPETLAFIGERAFYGCAALQKAELPENVESIGARAFSGCAKIETVHLPETLQTLGSGAYENCTALKDVVFGPEMTAIPDSGFRACDLAEVHLPYKIKNIGSAAFSGNASLKLITIPAFTSYIASDAFADIPSLVIGGAAGSYAETFADDKGLDFDSRQGIPAEEITVKQGTFTLACGQTETIRMEVVPYTATDEIVWENSDEDKKVASLYVSGDDPAEAVVTANAEGSVVVTAKAGTVSKSVSLNAEKLATSLSLDRTYGSLTGIGKTLQLRARIYPSDANNASLVWSSSDKTVATVDGNGLVTAAGKGIARITAMLEDGSLRAYCFIKVDPKTEMTGLELSESTLFLTTGGAALSVKVLPEDSEMPELQWTSSDETVAAVDETGYVTAAGEGTAVITVSSVPKTPGGTVYSAECNVTVRNVDVPVEKVTLDKQTVYLNQTGASAQLTATVYPEDADVKTVLFKSSDESVAAVDENGKITAGKSGRATITAETLDGRYTAECSVIVSYRLTDISFDVSSMELKPGETRTVKAVFSPASVANPSVEWYTTDSHVATVDETGLVTAKGLGTADIKCRATDGTNIVAVCRVSVAERSQEKPDDGKPVSPPAPAPGAVSPQNTSGTTNTQKKPPEKPVIKKAAVKKITAGKKKLTVSWKKQSGITGYQIQYALKKSFAGKKNVWIKSSKTTSKKLTKLKQKKKYYIRIRAYKNVKGVKYYGAWSKVASKKTK